jgi:signal transduction histidine kinase
LDISERRNTLESLKIANSKLNLLSSITRHDILNQVTGLQAYLDFALEEVTEGSAYQYLKKSKAITRTIQSQIEFTRIYEDIGVRSPKWQDLYLVIEKVIGDLAHVDLEYHLDFSPILVYADPLLEKVFFTLVENTVRHGEKATDVWFSYELSDSHLTFLYEDNGIGVRMEDKDQIFLKHFGKNTGFGLFIALDILAITGITIRELGIPGKGVRFEIIIPEGKFLFPSERELSRD